MTQNTVHQPNPGNTYTTSIFGSTKGILRVPNALRNKFRAEYKHPSVPVSIYRSVRRASPGKQSMCGITSHRGTKPRCPTFYQHLGWRARGSFSERMGLLRGGLQDPSSKGIPLIQLFSPGTGRNSDRPCAQYFIPTTKCRLGATWLSSWDAYACKCPSSSSTYQELTQEVCKRA